MSIIKNQPGLKFLRQKLRNNLTKPEQVLWKVLRGQQLKGYKFRRQYSLGRFILDFYCIKSKLAIEIDGNTHFNQEQVDYDASRTKYLSKFNIKVLRFTNLEIMSNIEGIVDTILKYLP